MISLANSPSPANAVQMVTVTESVTLLQFQRVKILAGPYQYSHGTILELRNDGTALVSVDTLTHTAVCQQTDLTPGDGKGDYEYV